MLSKKGAQDRLSLSHLQAPKVQRYVKRLGQGLLVSHNAFLKPLQEADPAMADLLESMLEFNPYLRKTASELLAHPYFDDIRQPETEGPAMHKVILEVDSDANHDAESSECPLSYVELKRCLFQLIKS